MASLSVHPPEWIDSAPTVARSTTSIDAAAATVWTFIVDHESWPSWFTALNKVERIGTGQGVGSGRKVTVGRMTLDEEFTKWDEDEHFAFAVTKFPLPVLAALVESVQITSTGAGSCSVVYRQGIEGARGFGWLAKLVGKRLEGQTAEALANLKRLAEAI